MVESLKKIEEMKLQYVESLSEKGLEQLLDGLTKKYYQAFIDGDVDKMKSTLSFIKDVEMIVEDELYSFDCYVNYCMLVNANIIIKALCKSDVELSTYGDASIRTNTGVDNLVKAFNSGKYSHINGVDRMNIKKLYELCVADETLDEDIMELANALNDSFIDKEKYNETGVGVDE